MPSSRANQGTPDATPTTGERQIEGRGVGPPPKGAGPLDALQHRTDRSTAHSSVTERPGLRQLCRDAEEFHLCLDIVELLAAGIIDAGEREQFCALCGHDVAEEEGGAAQFEDGRPDVRLCHADDHSCFVPWLDRECATEHDHLWGGVQAGERSGAGEAGVAQWGEQLLGDGSRPDDTSTVTREKVAGSSPAPGRSPAPLHPLKALARSIWRRGL